MVVGDVVIPFLDDLHCSEHVESVIDSSLDIFEIDLVTKLTTFNSVAELT
jgi:hypothetical protein